MAKQSKPKRDAFYYVPTRSQAITWSTRETSEFLARLHQRHPVATILQLREILVSEEKSPIHTAAIAVLDAYIKAGYSEYIPDWI